MLSSHGGNLGSMPSVPSDPDLRNIIDKLAQFVARNGPEFEEMTKRKQRENPKFAFLFGGEHYNYYNYKVQAERERMQGGGNGEQQQQQQQQHQRPRFGRWDNQGPSQQQQQQQPWGGNGNEGSFSSPQGGRPPIQPLMGGPPTPSATQQPSELKEKLKELRAQQQTLRDQIAQSEENLAAQLAVTKATQMTAAEDAIKKAKYDRLQMLAGGTGIDLDEMEVVVNPIVESCTKDSIGGGKSWIFGKATAHDNNQLIAHYLAYRVTAEDAPFQTRLHLIYLMNDVLHHCVRKNADELKHSLESVAVEMFAATSLAAKEDQQPKLAKLIKLWESKQIFSSSTLNKMRNSEESWNKYKQQLKEDYADMIKHATQQAQTTYDNYAGQHNNFVSHANASIQGMEQQKIRLEEQIRQAEVAAGGSSDPNNSTEASPAPAPKRSGRSSRWDTGGTQERASLPPPGQWQAPAGTQDAAAASPQVQSWHVPPEGQQQQQPPWQQQQQQQQDPNSPWGNSQQQVQQPPQQWNAEGQQQPPAGPWGQPQPPQQQQQLPPGQPQGPGFALPDLSRPPPGFPPPPPVEETSLTPTLPYYDLPAGLMVPLVKLEDSGYKPINPKDLKLPPPTPPTERLLQALEMFYAPPSHDHPRDAEGWEMTGLYEWGKAKTLAVKAKIEEVESGKRERSPTASPEPFSSRESSPDEREKEAEAAKKAKESDRRRGGRSSSRSPKREPKKKRYRSRSRTRSRSRDSTPDRSKHGSRRSRSRTRSRSRSRSPRSPSRLLGYITRRSPSPPSMRGRKMQSTMRARSPSPVQSRVGFGGTVPGPSANERLGATNKGHQMMQKMGWKGSGLGTAETGIVDPISGGEVRDRKDQYKGVGVGQDPFEQFRNAKSGSFFRMMKKRGPDALNRK